MKTTKELMAEYNAEIIALGQCTSMAQIKKSKARLHNIRSELASYYKPKKPNGFWVSLFQLAGFVALKKLTRLARFWKA